MLFGGRCALALALSGALGVGAAGCEASPRPLTWTVRFATPALAMRAAVVDVSVRRGGCSGEEVFGVEIRPGARMTPTPPSLVPGTWAFVAAAHDSTCRRFAESCELLVLPGVGEVDNLLEVADPETQICVPPVCRTGACRVEDAGVPLDAPRDGGPDSGGDVPPMDVPRIEPDVPMLPDTRCMAAEVCGNTMDDDCNGAVDCDDSACSALMECALCAAVMCPACQTCEASTGMCVNVANGDLCSGGSCYGGACCTGCWDGSACQAGTTDGVCGRAGGSCGACGACSTCSGGSCVARPDRSMCSGGRCTPTGCCGGCLDLGANCNAGTAMTACGSGGADCASCGECTMCNGTSCVPAPDRTACSTGRCARGACCAGCIDAGGNCLAGTSGGACGVAGGDCTSCSTCNVCSGGSCMPATPGDPCPGGACAGGACCTGCRSGISTCEPGTTNAACGAAGSSCTSCGECTTCSGGSCMAAAAGTSCLGGAGRCSSGGSCCTGCLIGGSCLAGTATGACGFGGNTCNPSCNCSGGVCDIVGSGTCATPFDVGGSITLPVNTCLFPSNINTSCPSSVGGTPEFVIRVPHFATWEVTVPADWIVQYLDPPPGCGPTSSFSCGLGRNSVSGAAPGGFFGFAIERSGGGCGTVSITITRL